MQQWNNIFKKDGKVFTEPQEDIPKIVKLFKRKDVKKVLDLGSGSGRHIIYLTRKGFEVYGFDIASKGIKITKDWLKEEKLKADLKIGDIYKKLPYKDNFFDAVISIQVIHHSKIKNIRKIIKEIERVLKPGGLVFVTVAKKKNYYRHEVTKDKKIAPRTHLPLDGKEAGLIHYLYTKELLRKDFNDFEIYKIWIDSGNHYCLLGELKSKL